MSKINSNATQNNTVAINTSAQQSNNSYSTLNNFNSNISFTNNNSIIAYIIQLIQTLLQKVQDSQKQVAAPATPATQLTLTANQLANISSGNIIKNTQYGSVVVFDNNKDGKLSAGDTLTSKLHQTFNLAPHTISEHEANAINGEYGEYLTTNSHMRERLIDTLKTSNLPNADFIKTVFDKDNSGTLSAGDIALVSTKPSAGTSTTDAYISLTAEQVKLTSTLPISNIDHIKQNSLKSLESLFGVSNSSITDTDYNGYISKGDVLVSQTNGSEFKRVLNDTSIQHISGNFGAELTVDQQTKQAIGAALNLSSPSSAVLTPLQIFDTDISGNISAGDTMALGPQGDQPLLVESISHQELTTGDIVKLQAAGIIETPTNSPNKLNLSEKETAWLQYASDHQGAYGGTAPTVLDFVYDNDNSGDISLGDSVGTKRPVGSGLATPYGPYELSLSTIDQDFFADYNRIKASESPQTLSLSDSELNKLYDLPRLSQNRLGTIENVLDSDGNKQLSVGDKVNFKQTTNQLDSAGQPIVKTNTLALDQHDLEIYSALQAPQQLSTAEQYRVQQTLDRTTGPSGFGAIPQATGGYYDNDGNGQLSQGDELELVSFKETSTANFTGPYAVEKRSVDENFLNTYNPPQLLSLNSTDKTALENILFAGVNFVGGNAPRITSIEDSDRNGRLSAGDKINLQQFTGQEDAQGNPVIKTSSVSLTTEHLAKLQNPTNANQLTLTTEQLANLNADNSFKNINFNQQATDHLVLDVNKDGKLSAGDTISGSYTIRTDTIGFNQGTLKAWSHTLTEDEVNDLNGEYGDTLASSKNESDYELLMKTTDVLKTQQMNPAQTVKVIFDKDGNNQLSAGDIAVIAGRSEGLRGERIPTFPTTYKTLTESDINNINPSSNLLLSNAEENKLLNILAINNPSTQTYFVENVKDTDKSGGLSVGDQIELSYLNGQYDQATGEPLFDYTTQSLTNEQLANYQRLTTDGSLLDVSPSDLSLLQTAYQITGAYGDGPPKVLGVIYDKDNSGDISIGDAIGVQPYTSHSEPNKPEFWALKNTFFETYQQLKNRNN